MRVHCAIVQLYIQNTIRKIIKTVNLRRLVYWMSVYAKLMNEDNSGEKLMLFPTYYQVLFVFHVTSNTSKVFRGTCL